MSWKASTSSSISSSINYLSTFHHYLFILSFSSFSSFSCIAVLLQQCVFHFSVDFVNFLSCLHPPPYMEVHFRRNPNTTGEKMPPLEGAVMTTPTLLLQSQLTVLAFPTPPSYTERGLWGDTQGTSLHPAGPPLVLGWTLLEPTQHLLVLRLITPLGSRGFALSPPLAGNGGVKLDLITNKKSL